MTDFAMDPRLAANPVVADWALSRLLLSTDSRFPWLILVPRKAGLVELYDLTAADRVLLFEEIARAGTALKAVTGADKINVAALGNMVSQLHVHVVARRKTDAGWPGSPWIAGEPVPYGAGAAEALIATLQGRL